MLSVIRTEAMCDGSAMNWFVVENKAPAVGSVFREPCKKELTSSWYDEERMSKCVAEAV